MKRGVDSGRSKYGVDTSDAGKAARTVNGILFASKREARRYQQLVMLERCGEISELRCQVRYPLSVNGVNITTYIADFAYIQDGKLIIEDSKGVRTRDYITKSKLMNAVHGIIIRET